MTSSGFKCTPTKQINGWLIFSSSTTPVSTTPAGRLTNGPSVPASSTSSTRSSGSLLLTPRDGERNFFLLLLLMATSVTRMAIFENYWWQIFVSKCLVTPWAILLNITCQLFIKNCRGCFRGTFLKNLGYFNFNIWSHSCGQSCKSSTIVNYGSRVVLKANFHSSRCSIMI